MPVNRRSVTPDPEIDKSWASKSLTDLSDFSLYKGEDFDLVVSLFELVMSLFDLVVSLYDLVVLLFDLVVSWCYT